jgi:hypothetical protein
MVPRYHHALELCCEVAEQTTSICVCLAGYNLVELLLGQVAKRQSFLILVQLA